MFQELLICPAQLQPLLCGKGSLTGPTVDSALSHLLHATSIHPANAGFSLSARHVEVSIDRRLCGRNIPAFLSPKVSIFGPGWAFHLVSCASLVRLRDQGGSYVCMSATSTHASLLRGSIGVHPETRRSIVFENVFSPSTHALRFA